MKNFIVIAVLPLAILLSACTSQEAAPTVTHAVAAPVSLDKSFGETVTYDNGVSVTISAPVPFTPSPDASGQAVGYTNLQFTVTVVNGTKEALDIPGWPTAANDDSAIVDATVGQHHAESLAPGATVSWDEAFSVADPSNVTLSYAPGLDAATATFTN